MYQTFSNKEKIIQIFILIVPILITQLGMFSMVFFNTIMTGRYNASDLAAVAIGSAIWNPIFIGISGILLAVSPIAAEKLGERRKREVSAVVTQGIYLSIIISIIVIVIGIVLLDPILTFMNLDPLVKDITFQYLVGLSFGIFPLFLFNVLRSFIYALGKTRVVMIIMIFSLPFNFLLNYLFIFGKWGFPELGGAGAGYATSITYWIIVGFTAMIIKTRDPFSTIFIISDLKIFSWEKCKEILRIGIPMGLSSFFETSMFAIVTILISKFTIVTVAAYQTALNIVSFLYMIPISISMAITVLVSFELGAKRYKDAQIYSWIGINLSLFIALVTGLLVVIFRYQVAGFYSSDQAVIQLAAHFLIYALFFQLSDALQATAQAALRGYKDVNIAFVMTLISYWGICLPLGYVLAEFTTLGADGYWIGLTVGLFAAGLGLSWRLLYIQKTKYHYLNEKM
ncbi:MATE family efflux transporter [Bacillus salitolerans]|uniref:Probable multidrug resistance protein NorM n=1 Tax=Bacillus salitolerans TaxID=1437434 RepID=A0ABW4LQ95_9BACI